MVLSVIVKRPGVLSDDAADLYDECVPGDVSDPTAVSRQVAAMLRAEIFTGVYPPGTAMPSQKELVKRHGNRYSEATMYRALAELAGAGLISMGPGRRTTVLERRRYRAEVRGIRWTRDEAVTGDAFTAASDSVAEAEGADPAVTDADLTSSLAVLSVTMIVEAANPARAGDIAWAIAEGACREASGWDLAGASVEARPADGD